jgi:hypothetical protein
VPHGARALVAGAAREGFLSGLNTILLIGGLLALAGAVITLWLVREDDIARERPDSVAAPEAQLQAAPA